MTRPRKTIAQTGLTDHELRILRYLEQRGPSDRQKVVVDLADPDSAIGYRRDHPNHGGGLRGSNGGAPLIMAAWCRRLVAERLVRTQREPVVWTTRTGRKEYDRRAVYEITAEGRDVMRTLPHPGPALA